MNFFAPLLLIITLTIQAWSQTSLEKEFIQIDNQYDTLTQKIYIDAAFCKKYNLKNETDDFKRMNVWQNPFNFESKDFITVCDIRWKFASNADAIDFCTKYATILSEDGKEMNTPLEIDQASYLKVYRENTGITMKNESLGYSVNYYYFIFVINRCVVKVFVLAKKSVSFNQVADFANEAARKINLYFNSKQ